MRLFIMPMSFSTLFLNLVVWVSCLSAATLTSSAEDKGSQKAAATVPVPKHDPTDQLFRRAPMASATRSVVIPLSTNIHLAFDAELLRTHVVWDGQSLNLYGPPYHGSSDRFICDFDGKALWTVPQLFPWSFGGLPEAVVLKRPPGTSFKGISTREGKTTLMYEIAAAKGAKVRVHETPSLRPIGHHFAVVRSFEIGPATNDLFVLVHAEEGTSAPQQENTALIERGNDLLAIAIRSTGRAALITTNMATRYPEVLHLEFKGRGPKVERQTNVINRTEARVYLKIPARSEAISVNLETVVAPNDADVPSIFLALGNGAVGFPDLERPFEVQTSGRAPAAKEFAADKSAFPRLDGDKHYKVEHFPVPKEIDLRVTGMDWMPNGDLVVCTWAGEVYFVRNAKGDIRQATYHRFARGLIEPMGIKVVDGEIYIAQKTELLRLADTNGDQEADLFHTINADWDFTGRYNAFAMGPLRDNKGDFYVFIGGNGNFWDVRYMGWAVRISADGRELKPFCSGLRVPHGFGMVGEDIFVTENQGNWIGACKLNHLQAGKFYGYPASWPAPAERFEKMKTFTPPAVWFPYTLAKSTSGMAVVPDDRLGPFKGQLLVADYQLSVLTRVMLEKVNGEWQGAVWPFAKGFLSGINRVTIGADGKVYVGGGKGAHWAGAVGPQMYSLDRLSFTGKTPFEVQEVHATADGFELTFTQSVDAEASGKADAYDVAQYTYKYHAAYGSPEIDHEGKENSSTEIKVLRATVSEDRQKVRLQLEGLRAGYVTMVRSLDVVNEQGESLRNDTFWYTLNAIPPVR